MNLVEKAVSNINKRNEFQRFDSGDTIGVYVKVREGEKERIQLFKGVVLKVQGSGSSRSFTVRKISEGIGVERTFPFQSPSIDKIEVLAYGKTRRSRLFYLRGLRGRAAKISSELAVMREQRQGHAAVQKAEAATAPKKAEAKAEITEKQDS